MVASERRLTAFVNTLPKEIAEQEDALPKELARLNSSPRVKLRKVYQLLDKIGAAAESNVACGKGCSDCCKMNVTISDIEASQIAEHTGRRPVALKTPMTHDVSTFLGQPCPFLKEDICSIYDQRPMVCRKHFNFDETPYWCHPSRSATVNLAKLGLSGVEGAYMQIRTARGARHILADIRDFFPT